MRIEFPPSLHGTSLAAGNGSEQRAATPQRAAEEVLGGGLGGGESGFCDGQADLRQAGVCPERRGARGTVVQWFRCMDYPSGGSRYQWRQPQRMACLKGSDHGGQWRPPEPSSDSPARFGKHTSSEFGDGDSEASPPTLPRAPFQRSPEGPRGGLPRPFEALGMVEVYFDSATWSRLPRQPVLTEPAERMVAVAQRLQR